MEKHLLSVLILLIDYMNLLKIVAGTLDNRVFRREPYSVRSGNFVWIKVIKLSYLKT